MTGNPNFKVVTHGFKELEAAFADVATKVEPEVGAALRKLAEPIKAQAAAMARGWSSAGAGQQTTAAGFRVRRTQLRVRVEQSLKKTTGIHSNYGSIQMRHFLIPAAYDHEEEVGAGVSRVIDEVIRSI